MALPKVKKVQSLFSAHEMGFFWFILYLFQLVSDKNLNENLGWANICGAKVCVHFYAFRRGNHHKQGN